MLYLLSAVLFPVTMPRLSERPERAVCGVFPLFASIISRLRKPRHTAVWALCTPDLIAPARTNITWLQIILNFNISSPSCDRARYLRISCVRSAVSSTARKPSQGVHIHHTVCEWIDSSAIGTHTLNLQLIRSLLLLPSLLLPPCRRKGFLKFNKILLAG